MRAPTKALLGLVAVGLVAAPLSACSSSKADSGSSGSSSTSASAPSSSTDTAPVAKIDTLTGKSTSVQLDPGFLKALTTLKLTPGLVGGATLSKTGVLSFPITSGNVTYYKPGTVTPYVQGTIHHKGSGITLTGGKIKVSLTNFTVDPGSSKLFGDVAANGKSVAKQVEIFGLDGSTLQPLQTDASAGTATLTGTTVYVSEQAAALLDKTFGTKAVTKTLKVGIATIVINT